MKLSISLKRAIQSIIFLLMIVSVALVWPLKLIRPMYYEGEIDESSTTIMLNEGMIMQGFIPWAGEISSISFYIYNEELTEEDKTGELVFRLFDANLQELEESRYSISSLTIPGICRVRIASDLQIGQAYYFTIENGNAELLFSMSDGVNLDARYEYRAYFTKGQYALCALAVLLAGGALLFLTEFLMRRDAHYVKVDFGFRVTAAILAAGAALWGLWNVFPGKKFTDNWVDILFYIAGILLFLVFALYGLLYKREVEKEARISRKELLGRVQSILQSFAFSGVMLGGVRYLNALSMRDQKLASNLVLACFALVIICGYEKKEIFNWYNLVYLILAIAGGIWYLQQHKGDEGQWEIYKGNALYFILWGIVVLNTVRILIWNRKNRSKVYWVYLAALVLLAAEMVRSRNGRRWPIDVAVFWGLFAVRVIYKGRIQQYLYHFTNGVFIHFIGISIYAMLYRPFHYYMHTRYPGVFHTVTAAAVYLVLVLVLAWIRFVEQYGKTRSIKKGWKELWLIGMAAAFLCLTASRTGLFAALILCPSICIVTALIERKDSVIDLLKKMAVLLITAACFFPIVFTACRIVPAVVGKPFTYEIEWFSESVEPGEKWNSHRYITLARFFYIAGNRIGTGNEDATEESSDESKAQESTEDKRWENVNQYSNGRLEIYRMYLQQLNWKGHETVNLKTEDGREIVHAHNVFIQVAHDFGIGAGIYFIVFCVFAGIKSVFYYLHHKEENTALIPLGVLAVFGVCGLVEWVYVPYIPTGFAFFFVLVLLIQQGEKNRVQRTDG